VQLFCLSETALYCSSSQSWLVFVWTEPFFATHHRVVAHFCVCQPLPNLISSAPTAAISHHFYYIFVHIDNDWKSKFCTCRKMCWCTFSDKCNLCCCFFFNLLCFFVSKTQPIYTIQYYYFVSKLVFESSLRWKN